MIVSTTPTRARSCERYLLNVGASPLHLLGHVLQEGIEVLLAVVLLHSAGCLCPRLAVQVNQVFFLYDRRPTEEQTC